MNRLFQFSLIAVIVLFAFGNLYPFIDPNQDGYYNTTFRYVVCYDHYQCLQEIGHALDQEMGWVSQSQEYEREVYRFLSANLTVPPLARHPFLDRVYLFPGIVYPRMKYNDPTSYSFWNGGWGGTIELYASMFEWSDGKPESMPGGFLKFYNWDRAKILLNKYQKFP